MGRALAIPPIRLPLHTSPRVTRESPAYLLYGRDLRSPHTIGMPSGRSDVPANLAADHPRRFMQRMRD
eukprot:7381893-Prymnesium_polylepis.1